MKTQSNEFQKKINQYKQKLSEIQNLPIETIKKYTVNGYSKLLDYHNAKIEHYKKLQDEFNAKDIIVNDPQEL